MHIKKSSIAVIAIKANFLLCKRNISNWVQLSAIHGAWQPPTQHQRHEVFSRRDQLSLRSAKKDANKEKKQKAPRSKKTKNKDQETDEGKVTRRGRKQDKEKDNTSKTRSRSFKQSEVKPAKRKDAENSEKTKPKRSRASSSTKASPSEPKAKKVKHPEADQITNQKKGKDKTEAEQAVKKRRSSSVKPQDVKLDKFVAEQNEIVQWIKDSGIDYNNPDITDFKKKVRKVLRKFEFFAPNIYWTTYKCGLTMWHEDGGKLDVATFSFFRDQRSTLISIACAELLATRSMHTCGNMLKQI